MPEPEKLYDTKTLIQTHKADPQFVEHMISLFLKHIPQTNEKLIKACEEEDWKLVNFYAHKLKTSIDLFNLKPLKSIIRNVEIKSKNLSANDADVIKENVSTISDYIVKCTTAMQKDFEQV